MLRTCPLAIAGFGLAPLLAQPTLFSPPRALPLGEIAPAVQEDGADPDESTQRRAMIARLIDELLSASPEAAEKIGPIEVTYYEAPEVNAFATQDENGVGQLIVVSGIIDAFDDEERLLRAVIAHELAHLIRGHVAQIMDPAAPMLSFADVRFNFVRQVEFDADRVGAELLTRAGFERGDLEDALLRLHEVHRQYGVTWLQSISNDHGSWVERVARITPNEERFEALRAFERGLAFIECRRAPQALLAFEHALEVEPDFDEARYGVVRAHLQVYYDNLPGLLRDEWLRPDFGPQLTLDDVFEVRGAAATAADRRRWREMRDAVESLPRHVAPALYELLLGTVDVLHPDGDEGVLSDGVRRLQSGMLDPQIARRDRAALRLALANNAALGLLRMGDADAAWRLLVAELEDNLFEARYLTVSNAARLTEIGVKGAYGEVFVDMLRRLLRSSRVGSKRYDSARTALERIGNSIGADLLEMEAPTILQVCRPTELVVGTARLGLFSTLEEATAKLGAPAVDAAIHPDYDAYRVQAWNNADDAPDVVALVEEGRALKLTTYRPGSAVLLVPADATDSREFRIEVGSLEKDLVHLVSSLDLTWPPVSGVPLLDRALNGGDVSAVAEESWIYLPDLALGLLIEGGIVRGVTVTSIPRL